MAVSKNRKKETYIQKETDENSKMKDKTTKSS